jgi:hypothetical protein
MASGGGAPKNSYVWMREQEVELAGHGGERLGVPFWA